MCLDIHIPSSSKSVVKRYSVEERVGNILTPFTIQYPKYFDDADGISENELGIYTQEEEEPAEYGSAIKNPPHRKIKRKLNKAKQDK